jgi:Fe-S-cluster-containing dehydrogenase component
MSAAASLPKFPAIVWTHPLLASLDARSRLELESAGELRVLDGDRALFATGDSADAIFVVVRGEIALRSGARSAELRRVGAGEAVGEEAAARAHATRRHDARAAGACEIAVIPAALLRRVMERSAASEAGRPTHDWARRWLVRALAKDALERADFARDVTQRDRDRMLDGGRAIELRRGEILYREGDESSCAYFLGEGIIRIGSGEEKRVLAYHKAGDFFGDEAISGEPRDATATATSDAWIFSVRAELAREIARDNDAAFSKALRVQTAARAKQREIRENATRHVLADLHRFETSRSLLAIDQERCIRCGHCAWSCASAHDDGVSRLLRHGDVVVAKMRGQARTLLLPSSCQHCKNPACMIDCPTGAITRDARGEVHIREELCTGCGSCAKACPWDNVHMAPRDDKRRLTVVQASAQVAVKCDLCHDRKNGPACVSACPTDAIVRIDPSVELDEVRAVLDKRAPRPTTTNGRSLRATAIVSASSIASAGAFFALDGSPRLGGVVLLLLFAALAFYAVAKRVLRARLRPHFVAHLALGATSLGVALAHARGHSALALAFWGAAALGIAAGVLGALVPRRLARIERSAKLPEELGAALRDLDARVFRELSGTSDLLKGLWVRLLGPFSRSPLVLARVCLVAPSQRAMREDLVARVRSITNGDDERLTGLDRLASIAVERQALRAQRFLVAPLRGVAFAHVVVVCALAVLVVLHVIAELRAW